MSSPPSTHQPHTDRHSSGIGLRGRVLIAFVILAGFSVVTPLLILWQNSGTSDKLDWVIHTHTVISRTEAFIGHLKDAETGQRGYLLTGRTEYLEPYNSGGLAARERYRELRELTDDNPAQQKRLDQVRELMEQKLEELAQTIELADRNRLDESLALVKSDLGKQLMDEIRALIIQFNDEEIRLLELREAEHHQGQQLLIYIVIAEIILYIVLFIYLTGFAQGKLISPILALTASAWELGADSTAVSTTRRLERVADSADELGTLAGSFLAMRDAIELRERELTARTQELEREVEARRTVEGQLVHAQKMEAIGQLAGGIAHDFNNLLSIVSGYNELLKMSLDREGNEQLVRYTEGALASVERGAKLTQRLLAFSRRQILEPEALDMNDMLADMMALLTRTLPENISIHVRKIDQLWLVHADKSQLENVLLNLTINARDAMEDGGTLSLETANISRESAASLLPDDALEADYVKLGITDTGTGIDAALIEKVVEPYFTTKPGGKGNGLGLSMAFGFARQSNGQLLIDSQPGRGTTVAIYLPRYTKHPLPQAGENIAPTMLEPTKEGAHILLVEDGQELLDLYKLQLRSLGYQVTAARSAQEAIQHFSNNPGIDMLLSDVVLTGQTNGKELAETLRKQNPTLPVLLMSGYVQADIDPDDELIRGAGVLQKPFSISELSRRLKNLLDDRTKT